MARLLRRSGRFRRWPRQPRHDQARDDESKETGEQSLPTGRPRRGRSPRGRCSSAAAGCRGTTAQAVWTTRPCEPSTRGRRRRARRAAPPASPRQHQCQRFIHRRSPSSSRIALSSLATQCHALKQPSTSPATSSASVQECVSRMPLVQPETQRRAEQRRNRHRPADEPHHAQAEPDLRRVAPRLELARRLRADLLGEVGAPLAALLVGFVTHVEGSRGDAEIPPPASP